MTAAGALPALFHDAAAPVEAAEVAWYGERLLRDCGSILDLACGAGRLLVPLARAGYALHGIDRSAASLACCKTRLASEGAKATLVRQAVDEVNLPFRYAGAYASGGVFQSLTDPAHVRSALRRIRAHLVPPGVLILDLFVPSESTQRLAAPLVELRTTQLPDGTRIALRSETTTHADSRIARIHNRYVHRRGTARLAEETESCAFTWYSREDVATLLSEHGFVDIAFEAAPVSRGDGEAFAVTARIV